MSDTRLQILLSRAGLASRRSAEKLIKSGRVTVNGAVVTVMGSRADPDTDVIEVDGNRLREAQVPATIVMHKPVRVVTTLDDPEGRETVADLVRNEPFRFLPVGRLDYHTEGLLLLTTDGALTNRLLHPKYHVPKIYMVKVRGIVRPGALDKLREGVQLDDGRTRPAMVEHRGQGTEHTWLELVVTEGRNRLVRRMCDAIGHVALRVVRIEMGTIKLEGLKPGQYRYLEGAEINALYRVAKMPETPAQPERAERTYYQSVGDARRGRGPMPGQDLLPEGFVSKSSRKERVAHAEGLVRERQRREVTHAHHREPPEGEANANPTERPQFRRFNEKGPRPEGAPYGSRAPKPRQEGEVREDRYAASGSGQRGQRARQEGLRSFGSRSSQDAPRDGQRAQGGGRNEGRGEQARNEGYGRNALTGPPSDAGRAYGGNDRTEGQRSSEGPRSEGRGTERNEAPRSSEGQRSNEGRGADRNARQEGQGRSSGHNPRAYGQDARSEGPRSEGRSSGQNPRAYGQNPRNEGQRSEGRSYGQDARTEGQLSEGRSYGQNARSEGPRSEGRSSRQNPRAYGQNSRNEGQRSEGRTHGQDARTEGRSGERNARHEGSRNEGRDDRSPARTFGRNDRNQPQRGSRSEAPQRQAHEHADGDGWDPGGSHVSKKRRFDGPRGPQAAGQPRGSAPKAPRSAARPMQTAKPQGDGDFVDTKANSKSPRPRTDPKKGKAKKKGKGKGKGKKKSRK